MEPNKNPDIQSDYTIMMDMISEAKENYNMYVDLLKNGLTQDDISFGRAEFLFYAYSKEDIEKLDTELAKEMLERVRIPATAEDPKAYKGDVFALQSEKDATNDEWVKGLCNDYYDSKINHTEENVENSTEVFDEYYKEHAGEMIRAILLSIKTDMSSLASSKKDVEDLESKASEVSDEYVNYMCSPEYENRKEERISELGSKLETSTNLSELERKKLERKIKDMKRMYDLSFLFERLEKDPVKEAKNIMNTFFDDKRSAYVIERYKNKMSAVGFNSEVYRFYFNLEEKYLPEEYHVYNNLFLFHVMRYIGYADVNTETGKSFIRTLNSSISKLIYEKYSEEQKEDFISKIEKVLDYFKEFHDTFNKNNFLHPNHPKRIAKEKESEASLREMMLKNLEMNKFEVTDEVKTLPTDELKEVYKRVLDQVEEENKNKKNEDLIEFINKTEPTGDVEDSSDEESNDDESDVSEEDSGTVEDSNQDEIQDESGDSEEE